MVDHTILLSKLDRFGIRGSANQWFRTYLNNRYQRVETSYYNKNNNQIEQYMSTFKKVQCGVPQGSILGPLLFVLYINDVNMFLPFNPHVVLYADDTNFLIKVIRIM